MWKRVAIDRRTAIIFSLPTAAMAGSAASVAGTGCMGNQQYSHTFDATGRYDYACDFHPSMKGSVIVEASGRDT